MIDLEDVGLEFSGGHDGDVLYLVDGSAEGDDGQLVAGLHYLKEYNGVFEC